MSLDNDGVFSYIRSGGSAVPLNSSDCKAFVDIEASSYLRDNDNAIDWYRLPLNGVEVWINKDGPAAINRSAKITAFNNLNREDVPAFPVVDRNSVEDDVDLYSLDTYFDKMLFSDTEQNNDAFVRGRVWLYDDTVEEYKLTHHGYVGSYGPTSNSLLRKFWIYDAADLLRDIPVGKEFKNPTVRKILNFVLSGEDDTGKPVGIGNTTPFTVENVVFPSEDELASRSLQTEAITNTVKIEEFGGALTERNFDIDLDTAASAFLNPFETLYEFIKTYERNFTRNRNNLVDVLSFLTELIQGVWYFEPTPDGIELHLRAGTRNADYGREFIDQTQTDEENKFTVSVKENDALSDIKPINTISVNGDSIGVFGDGDTEASGPTVITGEEATESYPYVKLRYDPLYEAAGNVELGPTDVESDATSLDQAEKDAYDEFIAHIEETTEGRIQLFGDPMPLPSDFITAVPACAGGTVVGNVPIEYSINDVHHKKYAGEHFVTELGVHNAVRTGEGELGEDGDNFTITKEYKQAQ
jgi:hypothetical protein